MTPFDLSWLYVVLAHFGAPVYLMLFALATMLQAAAGS